MNSFLPKIIDFTQFALSTPVLNEFEKLIEEFFTQKFEKLREICEVHNRKKLTWKDLEFLKVDGRAMLAEMVAETSGMIVQLPPTRVETSTAKSAIQSSQSTARKKKKICRNLKKRYQNNDNKTIFLKHFPSLPPEHSYLNTKIKLHMEGDDLNLRVLKNEFMLKVDESLIKLAIGERLGTVKDIRSMGDKDGLITGAAKVDVEQALQEDMQVDNQQDQDQQAPRIPQPTQEEKCLDFFGFGFVDATTL